MSDSRGPRPRVDRAVALRIDFLRLALVIGIVILHTPPAWILGELPPEAMTWPGPVKLFFEYGPLRAGVPLLSLISGYLLFFRPYGSYGTLLRRKAVTLLVPFLLWNALVIALHGLRGQNDLAGLYETGLPALERLRPFLILLDNPPDFPTYFLIDLFIMAALSPLLGALLARWPLATLAVASVVAIVGYGPVPTVRPDIALAFAAGAAMAIHRIDPCLLDGYWRPLNGAFLALSLVFVGFLATGHDVAHLLGPLRAAGVVAFWTLSAVLAPTAMGRRIAAASGFTFILFCAHSPALHVLATVWPDNVSYWLFYALAAPLVIGAVLAVAASMQHWGGPILDLVTGARATPRAATRKK